MNSTNSIIWLKGTDLPDFSDFAMFVNADTYVKHELIEELQSSVMRDVAHIIGITSNVRYIEPIPTRGGVTNFLFEHEGKKIFIVCGSQYSIDSLRHDFSQLNPDITIFVTQPHGVTREKVARFARINDISMIAIQIPEIITQSADWQKNSEDDESRRLADEFKYRKHLDSFLCDFPETTERVFRFMEKHEKGIMFTARIIGNLLKGCFGDCPFLNMFNI